MTVVEVIGGAEIVINDGVVTSKDPDMEKLFKDWPVPAGYHPDIDDAIADDIARASGGKVVWRDKDPDPLEPGDKY